MVSAAAAVPPRRHRREEPIDLPHKEYALLHLLVTNLSKAISRDSILYRVWGDDFFGDDRVVDVHISRLRSKLEDDPSSPELILTARGTGYGYSLYEFKVFGTSTSTPPSGGGGYVLANPPVTGVVPSTQVPGPTNPPTTHHEFQMNCSVSRSNSR